MRAISSRAELESALAARFGSAVRLRPKTVIETVSSGIAQVDSVTGGIPRGAITEIAGSSSSGRTSMLLSMLAEAAHRKDYCALVDATDSFDPESAAAAGVELDRVLWIRCSGDPEHALKSTDLLLQSGGFGFAALDLGDVSIRDLRRIPISYWFRFRRAIENTPTALLVIAQEPAARSCAALSLEMVRESAVLSGPTHLLRGLRLRVERRRPVAPSSPRACFEARAHYDDGETDREAIPRMTGKKKPRRGTTKEH